MNEYDTDVLIIGGGPVGLLAAMNLDAHGVRSIVVESDEFARAPDVKCNHVSARTMEAFRRLGIADRVRDAGMPADHPQDVVFRTSVLGRELARIPIPSRNGRRDPAAAGPDTGWSTPEPPHRVNQHYLEPILDRHAAELPLVDLRNLHTCESVSQDADGITARVRPRGAEQPVALRARYLIGADGGRSLVRKHIGARFSGDAVLQHVQSTCIRAPGLYERMRGGAAWGCYTFGERQGHVYAIDGREVFLVHTYLRETDDGLEEVDRDRAIRDILGVDEGYRYEVLSHEDWTARRLVADRFRRGRAFIAGDAAHLWVPMGGYGMNAGIADGLNLSWLIAAVVDGWADEAILDAYAAERQPITDQVSKFAMGHLRRIGAADVPRDLDADGPAADRARREFGELAYALNVEQFAAEGLNFGYSYPQSPIIVADGTAPPAYTMGSHSPSTVPGCRAPHFWLDEGVSLYDRLGPWYTLLVADPDADLDGARRWARALHGSGCPVEVLDLRSHALPLGYETAYLVVREDQHVVWRGDGLPADPERFATALGARSACSRRVEAPAVESALRA